MIHRAFLREPVEDVLQLKEDINSKGGKHGAQETWGDREILGAVRGLWLPGPGGGNRTKAWGKTRGPIGCLT